MCGNSENSNEWLTVEKQIPVLSVSKLVPVSTYGGKRVRAGERRQSKISSYGVLMDEEELRIFHITARSITWELVPFTALSL